jgi:hypothetical protein
MMEGVFPMRNLLMAGAATGLFLALGAANAYAVPQNSPYATMVPPDAVDGYSPTAPDDGYYYGDPAPVEGRSAYVDPDYDQGYYGDGYDTQYVAPIDGGFYYGGGGRGGHFGGGHFHGGHFGGGARHMR